MPFCIVIVLGSGCAGVGRAQRQPSVADLSQEWLEIKTILFSRAGVSAGAWDSGELEGRINHFYRMADRFFASPVGSLYRIHGFGGGQFLATAAGMADRFTRAERTGEIQDALPIIAEMDAALTLLWNFDTGISDTIHLRYFQLFLFFTLLIIMGILAVGGLYHRLEKAQNHARQSRAVSRDILTAQEAERSRIARELHDSVAQDLWRLSFQTDGIGKTDGMEERRRLCAEVVRGQQELMERVRRICDALIPPDFQRRGLADALRRLCYDFERSAGVECRLSIQEGLRLGRLGQEEQLQCFRLVQEALANIEKHAQAQEAVVVVRNNGPAGADGETALLICVSDNGKGFESGRPVLKGPGAEGLGIRNMRERAAIVKGKLTIDSESGEGTMVTLEAPL